MRTIRKAALMGGPASPAASKQQQQIDTNWVSVDSRSSPRAHPRLKNQSFWVAGGDISGPYQGSPRQNSTPPPSPVSPSDGTTPTIRWPMPSNTPPQSPQPAKTPSTTKPSLSARLTGPLEQIGDIAATFGFVTAISNRDQISPHAYAFLFVGVCCKIASRACLQPLIDHMMTESGTAPKQHHSQV